MNIIPILSAFVSVLVTMVAGQAPAPAAANNQPCFPCDPLWPMPYYYPDLTDCGFAWQCLNGVLTRFTCPINGDVIDFFSHTCGVDDPTKAFTCRRMTSSSCTP